MTPRERVMMALRCRQPDRVPYCEIAVDRALAQKIMGWGNPSSQAANLEENQFSVEESKSLASYLKIDNLSYIMRAPVYAKKQPGLDGRLFYGEGLIKTEEDLSLLQLPDPYDDALYAGAERFVKAKGDFACFFVTRIGIFSTILSMGFEAFSIALYENPSFVETFLDRYCNWAEVVAEHICGMGFDAYVSTDDMAFKSGPFFSPQTFRDLVIPRYKKISEKITLPWIIHSDGNMTSFIPDLLTLGIAGFHPNEKGAMDIRDMKHKYEGRLCLLGNVDLNILGNETPADVQREVMELIRDVGPAGGYIVTSGNSLAGYLIPENVNALSTAVQKYGRYPINLDKL